MKQLIAVVFVSLFLLNSCSESNEDKIIKAFKEYAQKNLDDPSALEEIVDITDVDTISTKVFKSMLTELKNLKDSISRDKKISDSLLLYQFQNHPNRKSFKYYPKFIEILTDNFHKQEFYIDFLDKVSNGLTKYTNYIGDDSLLSLRDTTIYQKELSYRIKDSDKLILKKVFALCDTTYSHIDFKPTKEVDDEYILNFLEQFDLGYSFLNQQIELEMDIWRGKKQLLQIIKEHE